VEGGRPAVPSAWIFRDAMEGFEEERLEVD
jgi:hypothetical protein